MGAISPIDDFQQYSGFIVKVLMKNDLNPLIGWLTELRQYTPQGGKQNGKYPTATLYVVDDWENFNLDSHTDGPQEFLSAEEVESIEILGSPKRG